MPVKSLKLKMLTQGRTKEHQELRRGLWRTHTLMNQGVAYYMEWLIALRQQSINNRSEADVIADLLLKVQSSQRSNIYNGPNPPTKQLTEVLRDLYELIIPSSIGLKGDAQQLARAFLSPLVDPDSEGGMGTSKAGNKPRWKRLQESGDPRWEEEFKKHESLKANNRTPIILKQLQEWGLKPLIPLFTDSLTDICWLPKQKKQFARTWDRDMFQQAIERLLSWESWNQRLGEEQRKLMDKLTAYDQIHFPEEDDQKWLSDIQQYELIRHEEIKQVSFAPNEAYKINPRQLRLWKRIADKWVKLAEQNKATEETCQQIVTELQTAKKGEFGDPHLYRYLAHPSRHHLWLKKPERLYRYAVRNELQRKYSEMKQQASSTPPDAISHPIWIRYDALGGNLHDYQLTASDAAHKHLHVTLSSLLWPNGDGFEERKDVTISLATSQQFYKQFQIIEHKEKKKKQDAFYIDYSSKLELPGEFGGAKIQFNRNYIENRKKTVNAGDIGDVFFNITVDIQSIPESTMATELPVARVFAKARKDWPKVTAFKPNELTAYINNCTNNATSLGADSLTNGLRVISVDLGQRTAAAVSIFEVMKEQPPKNKLSYPIEGTPLFAVHCRSLLLPLPGENVPPSIEKIRQERYHARRQIKWEVNSLAEILKLNRFMEPEERRMKLEALLEAISTNNYLGDEKPVWHSTHFNLLNFVQSAPDVWLEMLKVAHRKLEPVVGRRFSLWRKSLSMNRKGIAGLSMWSLEELEDTRKLLISWSKRSREPGEINRIANDEKFASHLLKHIQQVKGNRLKQTANAIVMTALGYKYDNETHRWMAAYPASQLILFEDLTRYLTKIDRSRKENSKLMKWSHRSIPFEVYQQAQTFGLLVGDVRSDYTSRFHAKTGAPGIRCHVVTKEDLLGETGIMYRIDRDFLNKINSTDLQPGDIVPLEGGEHFISLNPESSNRFIQVHADLNAAQNLQRRFWSGSVEPYRVPALVKADHLVPKKQRDQQRFGKGGFIQLKNRTDEVYIWDDSIKLVNKTSNRLDTKKNSDIDPADEVLEEAQELEGSIKTLMTDSSGTFFPKNGWVHQPIFWGKVKAMIYSALVKRIKERVRSSSAS